MLELIGNRPDYGLKVTSPMAHLSVTSALLKITHDVRLYVSGVGDYVLNEDFTIKLKLAWSSLWRRLTSDQYSPASASASLEAWAIKLSFASYFNVRA